MQPELAVTTLMVKVRDVPVFDSRMSLRTMLVIEGNGPAVSDGVTAQVAFVDVVLAAGEEDEEGEDGLVELEPHPNAAPSPTPPKALNAIRRWIRLLVIRQSDSEAVKQV